MEEDIQCTPPEIQKQSLETSFEILPEKSVEKYNCQYDIFMEWCKNHGIKEYSENVLVAYFSDLSKEYSISSMWSYYSMVKATLSAKKVVDISKYKKLTAFLKQKGRNHIPKTSKTFSQEEILNFLLNAPDEIYLTMKMKCSETQLSIAADDMEICDGTTTITNGPQNTRSTSHSSTNGSIITMTLKNNHLIVETEERNDLEEDSRETTMKYSPGARDGVFVVEVQQGSRRSPGSGAASHVVDKEPSVSISDQCALVHNPPDRYSDEETLEECDEYYVETTSPSRDTPSSLHLQVQTGLTQSNSSLSSSSAQTYRYGNQQGYESGYYGYPTCNGDTCDEEPIRRVEVTNKPKIISEIFKTRSDSKCSEPVTDGFGYCNATLKSSKDDDDPIQQEQIRLGNSICVEAKVETVNGSRAKEPAMSKLAQQKIVPDPKKLEKLQNDISPSLDVTEADVRSADYENKGFESTDLPKT